MTTQSTCPESSRLQQLLDGAMPAQERVQLQEHLGACNSCQQALERLAGAPPSWPDMAQDLRDQVGSAPKPSQALRQLLDEVKADSERTIDSDEEAAKQENANDEADFAFLQPSDRPGYLGRLGHYEVMAVIGRGGMGVVFRAFDTVLQRVVAVKVLAPQLAVAGMANPASARAETSQGTARTRSFMVDPPG
jgi:serine/threonine protein kinase